MKIIFLNAWNAKAGEPFVDFIKQHVKDTDVFCFQEAYDETKQILQSLLSDYEIYSAYKFVTKKDDFPQVTYVKRGIEVVSSGEVLEKLSECGLALYVQLKINGNHIYVCNYHGVSRPVEKLDVPIRLRQSEGLIEFFKDRKGQIIIGGDFNAFPETRSIKMFEDNGYKDLIKDFKIETTRNKLAWDRYPNNKQYFSDYVFVNEDVTVKEFSVPKNEISDHLPLILEIEL